MIKTQKNEGLMRGQLEDSKLALEYILGGKSTFTIVGQKHRFTYKVVRTPFNKDAYFVSLLNGANNETDFGYMGMLFPNSDKIKVTKGSKIGVDAISHIAFNFTLKNLVRGVIPKGVAIYHEGRCGRCGRKLTVPSSIENGFGEVCASLMR